MATYDAGTYFIYQLASGTTYDFLEQNFSSPYTYDDTEADNTFEVGDDINDNAIVTTFLGTLTVPLNGGGTVEAMVADFSSVSSSQRVLILPDGVPPAYVTLPDSIDLDTLDTSDFVTCFAAGTGIATALGDRPVETLRIGDKITTADGRQVPVKWIGCQTILTRFRGDRARMIRIRKGALAEGLPHSDLTVTGDHGMVLDGYVVNASALVNGHSICQVPLAELPAQFTVYHVETEAHDVILANGAATETYVDYAARSRFDNHAEYRALYGEESAIPEMAMPRISAARLLPDHLRVRLGRRIEVLTKPAAA
ncbi:MULTISPECIES: Hint domain-containing protein [Mameliella]|uniref:tRNA(1-methyladenosine) methyltransferase-related protein n=1 Tax=Mameliella alba TaxID=561184 RepID=A0A0B3S7U7_9RHOB|nr:MULTISPECIES: Hint domain-containing protein [Mameliella]KHQ52756.1 tRNA(1-methyladenosine) methyltransferase-related protein [Mameliella alba]MDD9729337.1 Hint domain-containing protein [Mameliella sp. AT18]ODM50216.1 hypothetical protein A9320_00225 [Ruegeria sp. PBVC088]